MRDGIYYTCTFTEFIECIPLNFSAKGGSLPDGWPACQSSGRQAGAYGGES
ncbi:MAG: hypothetical protein WCE90_13490 [Candidatus Zixiibacteriota bacterium]